MKPVGSQLGIDEEWYRRSYPAVALEMSQGKASTIEEHYVRIGEPRGYLKSRGARRFECTARNKFSGLWFDEPDSDTLLRERIRSHRVSPAVADKIRDLIRDGYCVLDTPVPYDVVDNAVIAHDAIFAGEDKRTKFSGVGANGNKWSERVLTHPAKALDIHMHSKAIRDLFFHDNLVRVLQAILGEGVLATQTLGFWRGSQQAMHQDSAFVTYSCPLQFVGVWIALEDITPGSGELIYAVASHKLAPYLFHGELSVHEASRLGTVTPESIRAEKNKYEAWLAKQLTSCQLDLKHFRARKGDVLIWNASLAHGGTYISTSHTRKSIVAHFCPSSIVPTYFERRRYPLQSHNGGALFSSVHHQQVLD